MPQESAAPLPGWLLDDDRLKKTFRFRRFSDAIAFMVRVSFFCERADHHPEWKNIYNRVEVELTTHDSGGVTEKDHALAREMDKAFASFRPAPEPKP